MDSRYRIQPIMISGRRGARAVSRVGPALCLTLACLVLEYTRLQDSIVGLSALKLPTLTLLGVGIALLGSRQLKAPELQTRLFVGLLVLMSVHVPIAVNNYWALWTTVAMFMTFVFYLAIIEFVDSLEKMRLLIRFWIACHVYLAITAILTNGRGLGSFLGDENDVALAINIALPVVFAAGYEAMRGLKRWVSLGLVALLVVSVTMTRSRGGLIGLIAVGCYCWFRARRKVAAALVVGLLALTAVHLAPVGYWEKMQTIVEPQSEEDTGQIRIYSWKTAWRIFLDHPLIGVGPQNFPWNFEAYESPDNFTGVLHGGRAAHSVYFTLLSELGLVGASIFLLILLSSLRDIRQITKMCRSRRQLTTGMSDGGTRERALEDDLRLADSVAVGLVGSLVGYLVSGIFLSALYYPHFWLFVAFTMALKRTVTSRLTEATEPSITPARRGSAQG